MLGQQASQLSPDAVSRIMEVFSGCELNLRDAASKKILIEIALLKAIQARGAMNLDTVLRQLQQLRTENPGGGAAPPPAAPFAADPPKAAVAAREIPAAQKSAGAVAPVDSPAQAVLPPTPVAASPTPDGMAPEELELLWARLVEAAQRASPFVRSYLLEAHPVSFANNVFTIGFDPEFAEHVALVDNVKNHHLLQTKLHELGHAGVQIKFVEAEAPPDRKPVVLANGAMKLAEAPPAPSAAKPAKAKAAINADEFKNDPLIQKALEVFRGTIADAKV
jgi:DNA polymerase-3 subunit gamma/tau